MRSLMTLMAFGLAVAVAPAADFPLTGENTKITFVGSKPQGKHEGGFKTIKGVATLEGADVATMKITVEIDMNSTFSDDDRLTAHLKSPDFFGVKANPKAKFVSSKIEKKGDEFHVTGKLTLAGKTKELTFPATIAAKEDSLTLTSAFKINRNDWGISFGKGKINDEVSLSLKVSASK